MHQNGGTRSYSFQSLTRFFTTIFLAIHILSSLSLARANVVTTTIFKTVIDAETVTYQLDGRDLRGGGLQLPLCSQVAWTLASNISDSISEVDSASGIRSSTSNPNTSGPAEITGNSPSTTSGSGGSTKSSPSNTYSSPSSTSSLPSTSDLSQGFVLGGTGSFQGLYFEFDSSTGKMILGSPGDQGLASLRVDTSTGRLENSDDPTQFVILRYDPSVRELFPEESEAVLETLRTSQFGTVQDMTATDFSEVWYWNITINGPILFYGGQFWRFVVPEVSPSKLRLRDFVGSRFMADATDAKDVYMLPTNVSLSGNSSFEEVSVAASPTTDLPGSLFSVSTTLGTAISGSIVLDKKSPNNTKKFSIYA
ncbi:hypothetical protein TWF694_003661 [Orbilia ellipsospora]|uniref:Uncharacterized protein n=1 Tax=Orbilia ellipsospora TaxID=2528407 RepID=A0AAV9WZ75_9PEZI